MIILLFTLISSTPWDTGLDSEVLGLMLRARMAQQRNQLVLAETLADEAIRIDVENCDARVLRMELRLSRRERFGSENTIDNDSLTLELKQEMGQFPQEYRFPKLLGMLLARDETLSDRHELDSAQRYLELAVDLMEQNGLDDQREKAEIHYFKGQWLLKKKQYYDASQAFHQVVLLNPEMTWAWFYAGQGFEMAHFLRSAQSHYQEFKLRTRYLPNPTEASLRQTLRLIEVKLDPSASQIDRLLMELRQRKASVGQYLDAAGELFRSNRIDASYKVLLEAPHSGPRHGLFHVRMFVALMSLGKYDEALKRTESALAEASVPSIRQRLLEFALEAVLLSGDYAAWDRVPTAWRAMAEDSANGAWMQWVLDVLGEGAPRSLAELESIWASDELVVSQVRAVRKSDPQTASRLFVAGLFWRYHHFDAAANIIDELASKKSAPLELRLTYADALSMMGRYDESFALYETTRKALGPSADLLNNYGYFMLMSERSPMVARELIEESLRLDPDCRACLDSLGWAFFKLGDFNRAEQLIRRALERDADDPEKLEHLGDTLWHLGDHDGARRAWSEALQNMSDFAINDQYLAILNKMDPAP